MKDLVFGTVNSGRSNCSRLATISKMIRLYGHTPRLLCRGGSDRPNRLVFTGC